MQVLTEHMGRPTLIYREGGSIPALVLMRKHLNIESTMFAFGLPDDNLHSPNEVWARCQNSMPSSASTHAWLDQIAVNCREIVSSCLGEGGMRGQMCWNASARISANTQTGQSCELGQRQ